MSIEPAAPGEQAGSAGASGPVGANDAGGGSAAAAASHVFICYPRVAESMVARFHDALLAKLRILNVFYTIFRDKGPDADASIVTGDIWWQTIDQNLHEAACCLVVLIPAILQRPECKREISLFQKLKEQDARRFFYPISFVAPADMQGRLQAAASDGDEVAKLMLDTQFDDFSAYANGADADTYGKAIAQIANKIDARFNKTSRLRSRLSPPGPAPSPAHFPKFIAGAAALLAAAVVVVAAITQWPHPVPTEPTQPPTDTTPSVQAEASRTKVDAPFDDLLVPLKTLAEPRKDAAEAAPLAAGRIAVGDAIKAIWRLTADGTDWYEFDFADGSKRFVQTSDVPVWQEVDPNLELVAPVEAYAKPLPGAERVRTLQPGDLRRSRQYRVARAATIEKQLWYRVAWGNADVFFSGDASKDALLQWTPFPGCLIAAVSGWSVQNISNEIQLEPFMLGSSFRNVQAASFRGQQWFRVPRDSLSYAYLRADWVKQLPPDQCH